jgi:hypothetical protein
LRSSLLIDADRIFRAQNRHGGRKADIPGSGGRGGEDGDRGRRDVVGAVMLAKTVEIEADLIGQFDFFQQVLQPVGRALQRTSRWIGGIFSKGIEADFHGNVLVRYGYMGVGGGAAQDGT